MNEAPLKYRLFIMTDLAIGARRGEVAGLTWNDINFDKGTIKIERNLLYNSTDGIYIDTPKTEQSYRVNKISPWLVEMFKEYKAEQEKHPHQVNVDWIDYDFVFCREDGQPVHPNSWLTWFSRFQESHNFRKTTIQELRHTAPTLLISAGLPTKLVSGRLGHGSTKTTDDIYADYLQETDEVVNTQMDTLLFNDFFNKENE
jgi:integrase